MLVHDPEVLISAAASLLAYLWHLHHARKLPLAPEDPAFVSLAATGKADRLRPATISNIIKQMNVKAGAGSGGVRQMRTTTAVEQRPVYGSHQVQQAGGWGRRETMDKHYMRHKAPSTEARKRLFSTTRLDDEDSFEEEEVLDESGKEKGN